MKQSLLALFCLFLGLTFGASSAKAVALPEFPSCTNPTGSLIANNDGPSGIAGTTDLPNGNDKVYSLSESTLVQCFCPANGSGIQTNWLKISDWSQEEIDSYKNQGWVFIPDGSAWGLDESNYLAKNLNYSCGGSVQGSSTTNNGGGDNPGAPVCNDQAPKSAPVLTSVGVNNDNSVTLTWTPAADPVSYYLIAYGTTPGNYIYGNPNVGGHDTTSYTVKGLSGGVTYYFVVRAGNGCMPGSFSNSLTSTPRGQVITQLPEGFSEGVLAATTDSQVDGASTAFAAVCGCVWKPILLGEMIVLFVLFIYKRKDANWKRRFLTGFVVSILAYIVFLIWNRNCIGGIMNFKFFAIPCKFFWAVSGAAWLLLFAVLCKSKKIG